MAVTLTQSLLWSQNFYSVMTVGNGIELVPVNLEPILAAHESKHPAHFAQETLDPGDNGALQFRFTVFLAQLKEVEGLLIADRQFGLVAHGFEDGLFEIGLTQQGLFVGVVGYPEFQDVLRPSEVALHGVIP
jgi:hypothetical protein